MTLGAWGERRAEIGAMEEKVWVGPCPGRVFGRFLEDRGLGGAPRVWEMPVVEEMEKECLLGWLTVNL